MSIFDSRELMIVKGVGPVPGDTASAEQPLQVVNFYDADSGYALSDWTPNIPSLKNGGLWADSSISDGRSLIAGQNTNVIETIVVTLTGATGADFASQFAKLQRMIQDARDFWTTFDQIEPVYIRWWAACAPGPQFALIYNIDMDVEWQDQARAQAILTLSVEREFGWRGVHPGGNPKEWTYFQNGQAAQWKFSNANMLTGTDHLGYSATLTNRAELAASTAGYLNPNFIDIPASKVPGDLPALLSISVLPTGSATAPTSLLIGKSTKKTTGNPARTSGNNQFPILTLNAADCSILTDTTLANDTGASRPIGGGTAQRSQTTFVTATMASRLSWDGLNYTNGFDPAVMRGRYAVFVRARVSAAATVSLQLGITEGSNANLITTTPVTLSDLGAGGTGNTTDWAFVYLGSVNIPYNSKRTTVGGNGGGVLVDSGSGTFSIYLQAARTSGAGNLYVNDVFFLPIDEGAISIIAPQALTTGRYWDYDNTGYYNHGDTDDVAGIKQNGRDFFIPELRGAGIKLTPNVQNRLIMMCYVDSTKRSYPADPSNFTVRVNIVPRWSGVRDA